MNAENLPPPELTKFEPHDLVTHLLTLCLVNAIDDTALNILIDDIDNTAPEDLQFLVIELIKKRKGFRILAKIYVNTFGSKLLSDELFNYLD